MSARFPFAALITSACLLCAWPASADTAEQSTVAAHLDADGVQRASVVGGDYFFRPSRLIVRVNVPVELTVSKQEGIVPHTLVIEAPDGGVVIDEELHADTRKISFVPTTVGVYPYYCTKKLLFFKSHRARGMEGALEVVP